MWISLDCHLRRGKPRISVLRQIVLQLGGAVRRHDLSLVLSKRTTPRAKKGENCSKANRVSTMRLAH